MLRFQKLRMRSALLTAGLLFVFTIENVTLASGQFPFFGNPLVGEKAPDFTLTSVSGKSASLSQLRGGKPCIIFFWATWCPHCREQLKHLKSVVGELQQKGYQLLLVDLQEDAGAVKAFLDRQQLPFDVLLDADAGVAEQYGVIGVPSFYFVDASGIIQGVEHVLPEDYESFFSAAAGSSSGKFSAFILLRRIPRPAMAGRG